MLTFSLAIIIFCLGIILNHTVLADAKNKRGETINKKNYRFITTVVSIVLAAFLAITSCISWVPTGHTGIVTTFGRVHDTTLDAGIAVHAPWDNVINMDNREQRITFNLQSFSKDIQEVDIQGSINININKATAMILYREVGANYTNIFVAPRIQEDVKVIVAQYTAEQLIENRQMISDAIYALIKEELTDKGINVISLAIENIDFDDAFENAVSAKQVATQDAQRAKTEQERMTMEAQQAAERQRIQAEMDAEVAKIKAEAAAEVAKIDAEAEAYALQVKADAEAEANKKIAASLTEDIIEYTKAQLWNGQLPTFIGGNDTIPVINFDK